MADLTIKSTEEMVGSGHPTKADTLNRLVLVGHNTDGTHGANTYTGDQTYADYKLIRPEIKDYGETINAIGGTGGGTQDLDLTLGNVQTATVDTSANTFTFSNPSATGIACGFTMILTNGGSQTVTWPGAVDWVAGTAPTLTAAGVDVLAFLTRDAGTIWLGFVVGLDVKSP